MKDTHGLIKVAKAKMLMARIARGCSRPGGPTVGAAASRQVARRPGPASQLSNGVQRLSLTAARPGVALSADGASDPGPVPDSESA